METVFSREFSSITTYLSLDATDKAKCASTVIDLSFDPNVVILDITNENYLKNIGTTTTVIDSYNYINSLKSYINNSKYTDAKKLVEENLNGTVTHKKMVFRINNKHIITNILLTYISVVGLIIYL